MKRTSRWPGLIGLAILATLAVDVQAAKPVDLDGDGYNDRQDCNDNDKTIYPGAPEICGDGIDQNCDGVPDEPASCGGGTTCTDNDGDGFAIEGGSCGEIDCNDSDPLAYPNAPEICGDGIDQSCSGSDQQCGTGPHSNLSWADYPSACMNCHDGGQAGNHYDQVWDTTHYQWLGDTPDMVNQPGTLQGKLTNAVNSYCINIEGDWPVCGSCHVGRGIKPQQGDTKANIDCLMCHNESYALNRVRLPDGSMGPSAGTDQATLDSYVQNITPPTRKNCLKCHAYAGGGDGVKRGDLSSALGDNADPHFDVHMNVTGPNLQCQDCHVFSEHKTIGKGSDLRPTDDVLRGSEVNCANANCHAGMDSGSGHSTAGRRNEPDRHVARVACQSCHIPEFAKAPTEIHRDWRFHHDPNGGLIDAATCGVDGNPDCPSHPDVHWDSNLAPTLKFWNRDSDNYLLGDIAVLDPETGAYPTSRPLGDVFASDPLAGGKLTPFKYKTADAPIITGNNVMIALDTLEYLKLSGNVVASVESGLVNMGYNAGEPYHWIVSDTYHMITPGVNPAPAVADCSYCHGGGIVDVNSDSMLDAMGYRLKGVKEEVCNQCHDGSKKMPRTWDRIHNHLDKGSGVGCYFCHDFDRPERGLCSPCDDACNLEFVDNVAYPHQCN